MGNSRSRVHRGQLRVSLARRMDTLIGLPQNFHELSPVGFVEVEGDGTVEERDVNKAGRD